MCKNLVFTDASITPKGCYIGIYSKHLDIKETIIVSKNTNITINKLEETGFLLAMRKTNKDECKYFTDSMHVYLKYRAHYPVHWIPREMNKEADALANDPRIQVKDISSYLTTYYSAKQRIKLCNTILRTNYTTAKQLMKHSNVAKRLVKTILIHELEKSDRRMLHSVLGIKSKEWEEFFNTVRKYTCETTI